MSSPQSILHLAELLNNGTLSVQEYRSTVGDLLFLVERLKKLLDDCEAS